MDSLRRSKLTDTGVWPGASAGSPQVCLQDLKQEGALFTQQLGNLCLVPACWGKGHGAEEACYVAEKQEKHHRTTTEKGELGVQNRECGGV